jgi:hypothetical protein
VRIIQQQLSGVKVSEQKTEEQSYFSTDTLPEQRRLIEILMLTPPGTTYEEEINRRNAGINAVMAYYRIEEGETPKHGRPPSKRQAAFKQEESKQSPQGKELEAAMLCVLREDRPKICFLCLGKQDLPHGSRVYSFSTPGDLSKHFRRKHLSSLEEEERVECDVCKILLDHKMHLQHHALKVHGTVT